MKSGNTAIVRTLLKIADVSANMVSWDAETRNFGDSKLSVSPWSVERLDRAPHRRIFRQVFNDVDSSVR